MVLTWLLFGLQYGRYETWGAFIGLEHRMKCGESLVIVNVYVSRINVHMLR